MPNLQNAKKALRSSDRKRVMNDRRRRALKESVKEVKSATVSGADKKTTAENLSKAYQAIDKAAKRGIIKKNTASRKKSRLSKMIKTAQAK